MSAPKLTPILEAAKEILKTAGLKGMHVDAIAEAAVSLNKNMGFSAEDFSRKLQGALAANLKLKTHRPSFAKVEGNKGQARRGWYRVKIDRSGTVISQVVPPDTSDKAYLGKGGEYAVMGELLFWNFNVSAMAVDSGVDLVASKAGRFFHIQVKTSVEQDGGRFQFTIKTSAFTNNHDSTMFYVFVLRRGLSNEYIIMPSAHLQLLISSGRITQGPTLSVTIAADPSRKKYVLNGSESVAIFVGNFGIIV